MRYLFSEYSQTLLSMVVSLLILTMFIGVLLTDILDVNVKTIENNTNNKLFIEESIPVSIDSFVCKDTIVTIGEEFDYKKNCKATNSKGEDISSFISLYEEIDTDNKGEKEAVYILRYNGEKMIGKAKVIIEDEEYD